jgi:hypothetical protein
LKPEEEPKLQTGLYFIPGSPESKAERVVQWNQSHPALRFVDAGLWDFSHYSLLKPPPGADILMETSEGPVAYTQSTPGRRTIVIGFALEDSNIVMMAGFPVFLQNSIEWLASSSENRLPVFTSGRYQKEGTIEESGRKGFVNFADAGESNIAPLKIQGHSSSGSGTIQGRTDLSVWFLILVIAMIILEWWAFHRRMETSLR